MADLDRLIANYKVGYSLAQPFYDDPDVYEEEIERIFLRAWLYAGHASQIPEPGDHFLFEIASESVILVRQKNGEIRALLNVCRHRGSRVCLESSGHARAFVCPYHAWTYDLDGSLLSARHGEGTIDKDRFGLRSIQVRVLHGLVFVNFDPDAGGFDAVEHDFEACFAPYELEHTKVAHAQSYPVRANWKLAVENYCECYHCRPAHPEYSLAHSLAMPVEHHQALWDEINETARSVGLTTDCFERLGKDAGAFGTDRMYEHYPLLEGYSTGSEDGKLVAPLLGKLKRGGAIASDIQIGPLTFFLAYTDHIVSYRFVPTSAHECRCDISWIVRADTEEGRDYDLAKLIWLWDVTTIADKRIIENNQEGVSSRYYEPGPYVEMEHETRQFVDRYVDSMR